MAQTQQCHSICVLILHFFSLVLSVKVSNTHMKRMDPETFIFMSNLKTFPPIWTVTYNAILT